MQFQLKEITMASSTGGHDPAWNYAIPIEGNKNGTTCIFCKSTFKSGGITRLKSHLCGYDPHKGVKKCNAVPPEVKKEMLAWVKKKEEIKKQKGFMTNEIRDELRSDYLGTQTSFHDEEEDDDNEYDSGYMYPPDMHPEERRDYRAATRASNAERHQNPQFSGFDRKSRASRGDSSSQPPQQVRRSQSYRYSLPDPPEHMPSRDSRAKQKTIRGMLKGSRDILKSAVSRFFIYDNVPASKANSPHFKNMIVEAQRLGNIYFLCMHI